MDRLVAACTGDKAGAECGLAPSDVCRRYCHEEPSGLVRLAFRKALSGQGALLGGVQRTWVLLVLKKWGQRCSSSECLWVPRVGLPGGEGVVRSHRKWESGEDCHQGTASGRGSRKGKLQGVGGSGHAEVQVDKNQEMV